MKLFIVFFDNVVAENLDNFLEQAKKQSKQNNGVIVVHDVDLAPAQLQKIKSANIQIEKLDNIDSITTIITNHAPSGMPLNNIVLYHPNTSEFEGTLFNNFDDFFKNFIVTDLLDLNLLNFSGSSLERSRNPNDDDDDDHDDTRRVVGGVRMPDNSGYCSVDDETNTGIQQLVEYAYHKKRHGEEVILVVSPEKKELAQTELEKYPEQFRPKLVVHAALQDVGVRNVEYFAQQNQQYRQTSFNALKLIANEFFPKKTSGKAITLGIIGATLGCVAALQNYYFGGAFAKCFAEVIAEQHDIDLSPEDLESIRIPFAIISTLVNACINARSVIGAEEYLLKEIKTLIAGGKSKENILRAFGFAIKVLGCLVVIMPNIQIIYDAFNKVWGKDGMIVMELVGNAVNVALVVRGGANLYSTATEFKGRVFGGDNRQAAQQIREHLLLVLLQNSNDGVRGRLSRGITAENHAQVQAVKALITLVVGTAALWYTWGAYFASGVEGTDKTIELIDPSAVENGERSAAIIAFENGVSLLGAVFRYGMFLRSTTLFADRITKRYVAKPTVPVNERNGDSLRGKLAWDIAALVVGVAGLPGADGLVAKYLYDDTRDGSDKNGCPKDNTIAISAASAVIAGLGVGPFNAKDFGDVCSGLKSTVKELLARCRGNMTEFNRTVYGDDLEAFRNKSINLLAETLDADILSRYVASVRPSSVAADESAPLLQQDPSGRPITINETDYHPNQRHKDLQSALKELKCCTDSEYEAFLQENPLNAVMNLMQEAQTRASSIEAVYSPAELASVT